MITLDINLDDEQEVKSFVYLHGNTKGRALANRLGLHGPDSAKLATALSNYAWNKLTAIGLRRDGLTSRAQEYEAICDRIYGEIPEDMRPW